MSRETHVNLSEELTATQGENNRVVERPLDDKRGAPGFSVQVHSDQEDSFDDFSEEQIQSIVLRILSDAKIKSAILGVTVVDDAKIHALNRQYLQHDWTTDVLSFPIENRPGYLEGEVIVSSDTARNKAREYGWSEMDELLLYVIHGTLHLVGYGDKSEQESASMRAAEKYYLQKLGIELAREDDRWLRVESSIKPPGGMQTL